MPFPSLTIGNLVVPIPIIQGGMGINVSLHRLAAAVASEGGIGVISSAGIALQEKDVSSNKENANIRALGEEIRKAKELSKGIVGVNIMGVLSDFATHVRTAISEEADVIFSGASLPLDLPKYLLDLWEEKQQTFETKLVPIVSSARAASIICKRWLSRFDYLPDAIVVEGPKAGGHLGFKPEEINNPDFALEKLIPSTVDAVKGFEDAKGQRLPIIAAGGIFSGFDILKFLRLGASGVQMGTRFVATEECDADIAFKNAYVQAREEDVTIIKSPVGLPGRALKGAFLDRAAKEKQKFSCNHKCIKSCLTEDSSFCLSKALINAAKGDIDNGFVFCGANVSLVKGITSVKEIFQSLKKEFEAAELLPDFQAA